MKMETLLVICVLITLVISNVTQRDRDKEILKNQNSIIKLLKGK